MIYCISEILYNLKYPISAIKLAVTSQPGVVLVNKSDGLIKIRGI